MTQNELNETLVAHKAWLEGKPEGRKANLQEADLWGAALCRAHLQGADLRKAALCRTYLQEADLRRAVLQGADLREAVLWGTVLQGADIWGADLREADLREADLDYSCWPLWCGSLDVKVDARIAAQLAYHFCRLDCDDPDYIAARNAILDFANTFHRAKECGKLI